MRREGGSRAHTLTLYPPPRSLHEPAARNKTFDVCEEFESEEGQGMYEVVAHVPTESRWSRVGRGARCAVCSLLCPPPRRSGRSYLADAVSGLAKNT